MTTQQAVPLVALDGRVPQAVIPLETGELVAVSYATERTPQHTLAVRMAAWQVDADGAAVAVDDEDGVVLVELVHNASAAQLTELGLAGIVTSMRDMLLERPAPAIPGITWPQQFREEHSIVKAIAVAQALSNAEIDLGAL